ncbi:MAG TPA: FG-GAP repeat protein [Thermoguttaceae bacterium]|nr:FG-GAP repeat protein [Thermoguttaceae bacterium]HUU97598.1 FG-GAP repeat protein [Phycisphaerae bacterium]
MRARIRQLPARVLARMILSGIMCAPAAAQCEIVELVGDGPRDGFGYSVHASDSRIVLSRKTLLNGEEVGAAYILERTGATWSGVATLVPNDAQPGTGFGHAMALDADRLVGGAPFDDTPESGAGSAYVFERQANGNWSQVAKLLAEDGSAYDNFGYSVAISGDYVVVGAPYDGPGSAYVFERQPNATWPQVQKLTASDAQAGDEFGRSVAISADVIVVGAWCDDDLGWASGSAYVFERATEGTWSEAAKLLPSDGHFLMDFGYSVAVSPDLTLIGALGADGQVQSSGAAYVFERTGDGSWLEVAKLFASDGANSDIFGIAVALEGDVAVIGARGDDDHGQASGSAYVFVHAEDGTWSEAAKLVPDDGEPWDHFGRAVAVSGKIGVIGTYPYDVNEPWKPGKAYMYAVGPDEDGDGVMDACECPGDLNHDWIVGHSDLGMFLASWQLDDGGDCDGDGDTDHADLGILLANWANICP